MNRAVPVSRARSSLRGTDWPTSFFGPVGASVGCGGASVTRRYSVSALERSPGQEGDSGQQTPALHLVAADLDPAGDRLDGGGRLVVVDPLHRLGEHHAE